MINSHGILVHIEKTSQLGRTNKASEMLNLLERMQKQLDDFKIDFLKVSAEEYAVSRIYLQHHDGILKYFDEKSILQAFRSGQKEFMNNKVLMDEWYEHQTWYTSNTNINEIFPPVDLRTYPHGGKTAKFV